MHRAPTTSESLFSSGNALLPASVIPMKMGIYSFLSSLGICNAPFYGQIQDLSIHILYITIFFTLPAYLHAIRNTNLFLILIPGF